MFRTKNWLAVFLLLIAGTVFLFSQNEKGGMAVMKLDFTYEGQSLYFQNPLMADGNGFCVTSIEVNGLRDTSEIKSSAFEIPLANYNFKFNAAVHILIFHHAGCQPKLLNAEQVYTHPEVFKNIWLDTSGMLHFVLDTTQAFYRNACYVEQYRWNKWLRVGDGIAITPKKEFEYKVDINKYVFADSVWFGVVLPGPHSGFISKKVCFISQYKKPRVVFDSQTQCNRISFSSETLWQLYDSNGSWLLSGFGDTIDYSQLHEKKQFTLNYDNTTTKIKVNDCAAENKTALSSNPIILVYPNPVQEVFVVSSGQELVGCALSVAIFDLSGRIVSTDVVQGGTAAGISVGDLADGIYFVQISHGSTNICTRRIIVHH